jgi:hypothetical protein
MQGGRLAKRSLLFENDHRAFIARFFLDSDRYIIAQFIANVELFMRSYIATPKGSTKQAARVAD